jgi:hypothetical protein
MDIRHFTTWLLDTPAGRVYAATHGGRAMALANYQAEAAAELKRLRDAARDHDQEYPEPEPGYLPGGDDGAAAALALYESAMAQRRKAHTEQLRYGPLVRNETGPSMAAESAGVVAMLQRENPRWRLAVTPETPELMVRKADTFDPRTGEPIWEDVPD